MKLNPIKQYTYKVFESDDSLYKYDYITRVLKNASLIISRNETSKIDKSVVQVTIILHNLSDSNSETFNSVLPILLQSGINEDQMSMTQSILESFSKGIVGIERMPLEGEVAQDAEYLDKIGTIGMLQGIYSKVWRDYKSNNDDILLEIDQCYENLLSTIKRMNTIEAYGIGLTRIEFMEKFINQLKREIRGEI